MAGHNNKSMRLVAQSFRETKGERFKGGEAQRIKVSLNKAEARGAKIPKKKKNALRKTMDKLRS